MTFNASFGESRGAFLLSESHFRTVTGVHGHRFDLPTMESGSICQRNELMKMEWGRFPGQNRRRSKKRPK
jgi:hypothetical protein